MKHMTLLMFALLSCGAEAAEYVLPVFALRVPGQSETIWSSEVYVTNPGAVTATVYEGSLIGHTEGAPPCLPFVQPQITVGPYSTVRWSAENLAPGIGCPVWAAGALTFTSDRDVLISSRMVNVESDGDAATDMLRGFGQEVHAIGVNALPEGELLLPGIAWHPNACGAAAFDTNVFFSNPGDRTVTASIELQPGEPAGLVVDGKPRTAPFVVAVGPREFRQHRIAGADSLLTVCMAPRVGAFVLKTDGPLAVIASVVDRSSGDARTVTPIPSRP